MKIAVISDIHGNIQAFESVLEDIKNQCCEKIFCLGDLALAGPEPQKTVEKFQKLALIPGVELIQGNTDSYLGKASEEMGLDIKSVNPVMGAAYEADLKVLDEKSIEFLRNLPAQKEINIKSLKLLLVHGSPRANNENIFPGMPVEKIEEMIKGTNADVILCGHTHRPCGYQTNTKQTVINVGSVGRPLNEIPKACYCVIDIINPENKEFFAEHRFVDYDKETAAEIMEQRGFEGASKLAGMLLSATES